MEKQEKLFDFDNKWQKEWKDMPEFNLTRIKPILTIKINFRTEEDIKKFEKKFGINITQRVREYWYPKLNISTRSNYVYVDSDES